MAAGTEGSREVICLGRSASDQCRRGPTGRRAPGLRHRGGVIASRSTGKRHRARDGGRGRCAGRGCAAMRPCERMSRRGCRARLPGEAAERGCSARLLGETGARGLKGSGRRAAPGGGDSAGPRRKASQRTRRRRRHRVSAGGFGSARRACAHDVGNLSSHRTGLGWDCHHQPAPEKAPCTSSSGSRAELAVQRRRANGQGALTGRASGGARRPRCGLWAEHSLKGTRQH